MAAVQHHHAGRFGQAEMLYRAILAGAPDHADSLHLLGVIASQNGRHQEAIDLIERAIPLAGRKPEVADFHNNIALAFNALGLHAQAIEHFQKALALKPGNVDNYFNLGCLLNQSGRLEEAESYYRKAIALQPNFVEAHGNLAAVLSDLGRLDAAAAAAGRAAALRPNDAKAHYNLAGIWREQSKLPEAIAAYRRAVAINPRFVEAYNNLGNLLKEQDKLDEAAACFEQVLKLKPDFAEAHGNYGNILGAQGRLDDALASHEEALRLKPNDVESVSNLGVLLNERGDHDGAMAHYLRAEQLNPDYVDAHWNEALLLLLRAEFAAGWDKYEWRWRRKEAPTERFSGPFWDGSDLTGRTIMLYAEQGRGDTMQFIRYVPLVKAKGGRVVFECQPGLARFLADAPGVDQIITAGEDIPAYDVRLPLLSLPRIFGTDADTIPAHDAYLQAAPDLVAFWRQQVGAHSRPQIGIAWRGSPTHKNDRKRSIGAALMAQICAGIDADFHVLQQDARPEEIEILSQHASIRHHDGFLTDWADTAALVANLDLVLSVDTGVVHLAGALGKPAWVMVTFAPDWRWQLNRTDSPWYPKARIFRQPKPNDWGSVAAEMHSALLEQAKPAEG